MDFRGAPGIFVDWHDTRVEAGFSNFLFVDQNYRSHPVLRRILSLARKHDYKSLLVEEIREGDCSLLAEENAALAIRCPGFQGGTAHRLSFWRCPPGAPAGPQDFIGYAVFKMDKLDAHAAPEGHVYEAVLPPVRLTEHNNYIRCIRGYSVRTDAGPQTVSGVLYAQQNGQTFVCAHVALRTALACLLPDGDVTYSRMNALAGIDHVTNTVERGLEPVAMEAILTGVGICFEKIVHEPKKFDLPTEFQRDLYGFIESGDPALLGFALDDPNPGPQGGSRHIVPIIGHTFNDDAWVPDAQRAYFDNQLSYFSSESWLSSYVLHDDNFGPYYCLPRHFLKKDNFRLILGMRKHPVMVSATEIEAVALDFLRAVAVHHPKLGQIWYDRFSIFARSGLLVLRSLLIEKKNYLDHLSACRTRDEVSVEADWVSELEKALPERFWMIEASAQELFTVSRRKFGEILLDCSKPLPKPLDPSPLLAMRLPGMLWHSEAGQLKMRTSAQQGHTPIYSALQP